MTEEHVPYGSVSSSGSDRFGPCSDSYSDEPLESRECQEGYALSHEYRRLAASYYRARRL